MGIDGAAGPKGIAADSQGVWVGIPNEGSVVRIDPSTNEVVAEIEVTTSPCGGIALQPDAVWVSSCYDDHYAIHIDPRTNELVAEIDIGGFNGVPCWLMAIPGSQWVTAWCASIPQRTASTRSWRSGSDRTSVDARRVPVVRGDGRV